MNDEVNPKLQKFIEWLKLTDEEKINQGLPLTQREFSHMNEVSEPQLSVWKRDLDSVNVKPNEVKELFDHIIAEAKKPRCSPTLARLAWEMVNPNKKEVKEAEFTADEYINIGIKVREQLLEEFNSSGCCPLCGKSNALLAEVCDNQEP